MITALSVLASVAAASNVKSHVIGSMESKISFFESERFKELEYHKHSTVGSAQYCRDGELTVEGVSYPCQNVDFYSLISKEDMIYERLEYNNSVKPDAVYNLADVWGWTSPSGKEITISCMTNGVWFVDGTNPVAPIMLGFLPAGVVETSWCDVKVYKDTAYIVKDRQTRYTLETHDYGIQVFDLLRLDKTFLKTEIFEEDFVFRGHGDSHNIVVNTETGFLYTVGSADTGGCEAGLYMIDVNENRLEPKFAGCAAEDGYIHDAQCVVYTGPDTRFTGRELCFGYNQDTLTVYDVEDKSDVKIISRMPYELTGYTHQGWLTDDMSTILMNDELDEFNSLVENTRTIIVNVEDLENPYVTGYYNHPSTSIDHNLYVWGAIHKKGWGGSLAMPADKAPNTKYAYLSNYVSGLRVLDLTTVSDATPDLTTVGYFDVVPSTDERDVWAGAWSTYMHPSGVIAVNSIETGLFFLSFRGTFLEPEELAELTDDDFPLQEEEESDDDAFSTVVISIAVVLIAFALAAVASILLVKQGKAEVEERKETVAAKSL